MDSQMLPERSFPSMDGKGRTFESCAPTLLVRSLTRMPMKSSSGITVGGSRAEKKADSFFGERLGGAGGRVNS